MFYEPLEKLLFDLNVWKWVNQEELMRYTTKLQGKCLNLIDNLSMTFLNYANLTFHQISKCGGRIFG